MLLLRVNDANGVINMSFAVDRTAAIAPPLRCFWWLLFLLLGCRDCGDVGISPAFSPN